ncbi:OB-fold-containig protein [Altererythrobacter sp. GH1-8]|uniref:OB-fold-containig protein n=1 Tax=Altererythrobacter sp. GH1-8 TaxID=3349333 RepID=UPI00374CE5AF
MTLFEPHNMPFAAALVLMLLLAILQGVGLGDILDGADADFDADLEAEMGGKGAGFAGGAASLLGLGRVPLMAWLAVYLFIFAGAGFGIQALADSLLGAPFERWLAALITAGLALPVTSGLVRPLGAILPKDRTTAVNVDTLLGREAVITDGTARAGSPARAKAIDQHGQSHLVMVEPEDPAQSFPAGQHVILLRKEGGQFFAATAHGTVITAQ